MQLERMHLRQLLKQLPRAWLAWLGLLWEEQELLLPLFHF